MGLRGPWQGSLRISGTPFGFLIKLFHAGLLNSAVDPHPGLILFFAKVRPITGKLAALIAEIDFFVLVTAADAACFEEFALFMTAPFAVLLGKIIEHLFKRRIVLKDRIAKLGFEPFGIGFEVSQPLLERQAVLANVAIRLGKTFFTV